MLVLRKVVVVRDLKAVRLRNSKPEIKKSSLQTNQQQMIRIKWRKRMMTMKMTITRKNLKNYWIKMTMKIAKNNKKTKIKMVKARERTMTMMKTIILMRK